MAELPRIAQTAFVAPTASILGDVVVGENTSIWYYAVVDGRNGPIRIGKGANIQDHCTVVASSPEGVYIGDGALIGHYASITDSTIKSEGFVGIRAMVQNAIVESQAIAAACAHIESGARVKSGELWAGAPAKKQRYLTPEERNWARESSAYYVTEKERHKHALGSIHTLDYSTNA